MYLGPVEICSLEIGAVKLRTAQVGVHQVGTRQVGPAEIGFRQSGPAKHRGGQVRSTQFHAAQVRLLQPGQRDTSRTTDIRFNDYRPVGAAWLSAEVLFLVDGRERWREEYTQIRTDVPLADVLFDPRQWKKGRS